MPGSACLRWLSLRATTAEKSEEDTHETHQDLTAHNLGCMSANMLPFTFVMVVISVF